MVEVKDKVLGVLEELLQVDVQTIIEHDNLVELGMNSLNFVKMIVEFELAFDIEYPDELLDISLIETVDKLIFSLENLVQGI